MYSSPKEAIYSDNSIHLEKNAILKASFPGGQDLMKQYVTQNLEYPVEARVHAIEGLVKLSFFVLPDGSIHRVKILEGLGHGCDEEALELIESMPNWIPATVQGNATCSKVALAIRFELEL